MKDIYLFAIQEIEDTGKLSLTMRHSLQTHLSHDQNKQLALSCIEKILSEWSDLRYPKCKVKEILTYLNQQESDNEVITNALKDINEKLQETDDFILGYLYQAISDILQEHKDVDETCKDEDLEFEELEAAYCASMIYKYEKELVDEGIRKQRETDFWIWYIKEIANIQEITLPRDICYQKKEDTIDFSSINTIQEFVKAISYEFDYISHDYKDDVITIHVYNLKDGTYCPTCHTFSNHIKFDYTGMMKLGKIKNTQIRLYIKNNVYFCDHEDCEEESFMPVSKVEYKERMANYKLLVKTLGSKRVLEILNVK